MVKTCKKWYALLIFLLFCATVPLSGCDSKSKNNENQAATNISWRKNNSNNMTCYTNYLISGGMMTESENGYYYIIKKDNCRNIMFFDKTLGKSTVLCNSPNCTHDTEECSAFLDASLNPSIQYYGGYIYYIGKDKEQNKYLYQMSPTGTERKKLFMLCSADEGYECKIWLNNDTLIYYIMNNKNTAFKIYSIDMKTNLKKEVADLDGQHIGDIKFFDDTIVIDITDKQYTNYYKCDLKSNTLTAIKTGCSQGGSYTVADGVVYYPDNHIIECYDLKNNKKLNNLLETDGDCFLSYDNNYIYAHIRKDNKNYETIIYDKENNIVDTIVYDEKMQNAMAMIFGGDDFLFINYGNNKWYHMDKSQIGKETKYWVEN